jgi:serine/threonine protein kinase
VRAILDIGMLKRTDQVPARIEPFEAPPSVGRFRVVRVLSAESSHVYEVEDPETGERLALKLSVTVRKWPDLHARARNEVRALHEVESPHVIAWRDVGEHEGMPFFTMPLIVGGHVDAYVDPDPIVPPEGPPPETTTLVQQQRLAEPARLSRIIHAMSQAARGLAALHARDIIHRDLNPGHVLVRNDELALLIDLSLVTRSPHSGADYSGMVVGTYKYLAPEQALGSDLDTRVDLYNFGLILYELLAGRPPFYSENSVGYAYHHARKQPPPLTQFHPNAPAALVAVTHALLKKDPRERPSRIEEVLAVLHAIDPHAARAPISSETPHEPPASTRLAFGLDDDDIAIVPPGHRG